jgi:DNA repair protein RadC
MNIKTEFSSVPLYSLKLVKDKNVRYPLNQVKDAIHSETIARTYLQNKDCEHLISIFMDGRHNMLGLTNVAVGSISGVNATIRDIFKASIVARASCIVLAHNHSSGDTQPSQKDIDFTARAIEAGKLLGIPIIDHIIISSGLDCPSFSFIEHGLM